MRKNTALATAVCLAAMSAVGTAACGGSSSSSTASTPRSSSSASVTSSSQATSATTTPAAPTRPQRPGKPIGQAQAVHAGSATLSVTVSRLIDPLRDSGAVGPPGTRAVGVVLLIHNLRGETYDSTASGDVSISPSSGAAAPLFVRRGVCQTPLTDFESLIGAGETRTGCVGFAIPRGARVLTVRFSPHSRARGTVSWH